MKFEKLSTWVDGGLLRKLRGLRLLQAHRPTLQQLAAEAVDRGLNEMEQRESLPPLAGTDGQRRAFSVRLSPRSCERVRRFAENNAIASSTSAALRLLITIGVDQLLRHQAGVE